MATIKREFNWDKKTSAVVSFDIEFLDTKAEAVNIKVSTSGEQVDLPESPALIVENKDGERIFRIDHINKEEGHTFKYFDNSYSKDIIAEIDKVVQEQTPKGSK